MKERKIWCFCCIFIFKKQRKKLFPLFDRNRMDWFGREILMDYILTSGKLENRERTDIVVGTVP